MGVLDQDDPSGPGCEQEGVTKFDLCYTKTPPFAAARLAHLQAWRRILFDLGLIGQEPTGKGLIGFGNVSQRLTETSEAFLITATQTGHKPTLTPKDYSVVTHWDLTANRIEAEGPQSPSSESLTHAIIYATLPKVRFVFHIHSPDIWTRAHDLKLPQTHRDTPYGTPQIAEEVRALLLTHTPPKAVGLVVMGGHTNGIISFGETGDDAGALLIQALVHARAHP